MEPVAPLFIVGTGDDIDVAVFSTVEEAESFMEPPDVLEHEYDVYDALARKAQLQVRGYNVEIVGFSSVPEERSVRERVARFLAAIGQPVESEDLPIREFAQHAYTVISDWQRHRK